LLHRERILEYRDESQRLDQCNRLYDSSVSNDGFEVDASHIVQVLYYTTLLLFPVAFFYVGKNMNFVCLFMILF
jgi:hypothetical protein